MQWDDTLSKIAKEVADKHGIPTDQAKLLVETYVSCNMKAMRQYQPVVWINIGKFYLSHFKLVKAMLKSISKFREGTLSKKSLEERFAKVYPLLMAARWHDPRSGKRYRFQVFLEQLKKEGKTYTPKKWWLKPEPCREENTQESCLPPKHTISSEVTEKEETQNEKRKPGDLGTLST